MENEETPILMKKKVIFLGNSGVGKSNLLKRFVDGTFEILDSTLQSYSALVAATVGEKTYVELEIWDTAGEERFNSVSKSYYRNAHGVMLVYDVTDLSSFSNLSSWITKIREQCDNDNVKVVIVGSKSDLNDKKKVVSTTVRTFAEEQKFSYLEVSALKDVNVKEAFRVIVRDMLTLEQTLASQLEFHRVTRNPLSKSIATIDKQLKARTSSDTIQVRDTPPVNKPFWTGLYDCLTAPFKFLKGTRE